MKGKGYLFIACGVALALWLAGAAWRQHSALSAATEALAVERTDRLAAEAVAAGYEVAFEAVADGVVVKDSVAKELEAQLRLAEARLAVRVPARVESRVDTVFTGEVISLQEVRAEIAYDPFSGTIRFVAPDSFYLKLLASPEIELYIIHAADGRFLAAARSLSPNTQLRVHPLNIPIPKAPRQPAGVRWYHAVAALPIGAALWEIFR